jgi:hypothetical protein
MKSTFGSAPDRLRRIDTDDLSSKSNLGSKASLDEFAEPSKPVMTELEGQAIPPIEPERVRMPVPPRFVPPPPPDDSDEDQAAPRSTSLITSGDSSGEEDSDGDEVDFMGAFKEPSAPTLTGAEPEYDREPHRFAITHIDDEEEDEVNRFRAGMRVEEVASKPQFQYPSVIPPIISSSPANIVVSSDDAPPLFSGEDIVETRDQGNRRRTSSSGQPSRRSVDSFGSQDGQWSSDLVDSQLPPVAKEYVDVGNLLTEQVPGTQYIPKPAHALSDIDIPGVNTSPKQKLEKISSESRKPRRKRALHLESAAGGLSQLPVLRAGGAFLASGRPAVRLGEDEVIAIPDVFVQAYDMFLRAFERAKTPAIEDVTTFSKRAVRSAAPDIWVIEEQKDVDIDEFYSNELMQSAPRLPVHERAKKWHPLQERRRIPSATVGILGVPSEW